MGVVGDEKGMYGKKKTRAAADSTASVTEMSDGGNDGGGGGASSQAGPSTPAEEAPDEGPEPSGPPKGPPKVRVLLLTSESPPALRKAVAKNINVAFADKDVVVLSPAVTAGSSCTIERFTAAVCIAENLGHDGPTVDGCLQQWWRVRSLGPAGRMFVFILDPADRVAKAGPIDAPGIAEFLESNLGTSFNFLSSGLRSAARAFNSESMRFDYDRGSMAYEALTGVVHMRHKSMAHFTEILTESLRRDYAVHTTVTSFAAPLAALDHSKRSNKEKRDDEEARADAVRFPACSAVIDDFRAEILAEQRKTAMEPLSDEQLQQLHVHGMVSARYGVDPALCDGHFLDAYVQTAFNKEDERMTRQFYAFQRFHVARQQSLHQLSAKYRELLKNLKKQNQSAMAMYNAPMHRFYKPSLGASLLLDKMAPEWRAATADTPVAVRIADCIAAVGAWATEQSDGEYNDLLRVLGIAGKPTRDAGANRGKLIATMNAAGTPGKNVTKTATAMIDRVLKAAFGVALGERCGKGTDVTCIIDTSMYGALVEKYQCGCFADVNPFFGFAMVDGDELSCDATVMG